jgi:hypothetical protein
LTRSSRALLSQLTDGLVCVGANSEIARGMAREVASAAWEALSIGIGAYILIAATGFLAYQARKSRG